MWRIMLKFFDNILIIIKIYKILIDRPGEGLNGYLSIFFMNTPYFLFYKILPIFNSNYVFIL